MRAAGIRRPGLAVLCHDEPDGAAAGRVRQRIQHLCHPVPGKGQYLPAVHAHPAPGHPGGAAVRRVDVGPDLRGHRIHPRPGGLLAECCGAGVPERRGGGAGCSSAAGALCTGADPHLCPGLGGGQDQQPAEKQERCGGTGVAALFGGLLLRLFPRQRHPAARAAKRRRHRRKHPGRGGPHLLDGPRRRGRSALHAVLWAAGVGAVRSGLPDPVPQLFEDGHHQPGRREKDLPGKRGQTAERGGRAAVQGAQPVFCQRHIYAQLRPGHADACGAGHPGAGQRPLAPGPDGGDGLFGRASGADGLRGPVCHDGYERHLRAFRFPGG